MRIIAAFQAEQGAVSMALASTPPVTQLQSQPLVHAQATLEGGQGEAETGTGLTNHKSGLRNSCDSTQPLLHLQAAGPTDVSTISLVLIYVSLQSPMSADKINKQTFRNLLNEIQGKNSSKIRH